MIVNAEGKESLWRKTFPGGFWNDYYQDGLAKHLYFQDGVQTHLWFGDLDGDGYTEVLLLYHPATDPKSHSSTLICYSDSGQGKVALDTGQVSTGTRQRPVGLHSDAVLGVLPTAHGQDRRIVVMSRHEYSLSDPNRRGRRPTARRSLEYWHSGHLFHFELASLEGHEEIIAKVNQQWVSPSDYAGA